jgi:hypothetical protein
MATKMIIAAGCGHNADLLTSFTFWSLTKEGKQYNCYLP